MLTYGHQKTLQEGKDHETSASKYINACGASTQCTNMQKRESV